MIKRGNLPDTPDQSGLRSDSNPGNPKFIVFALPNKTNLIARRVIVGVAFTMHIVQFSGQFDHLRMSQ
jgi:hypothetical protein